MDNKRNNIVGVLALLCVAFATFGMAGQYKWVSEDASCPFLIRVLTDDAISGNCTTTAFSLTNAADSAANVTVTLGPAVTVASVISSINSATNQSGQRVYKAVTWEALSTDTVSNKLVAETFTLDNHTWDNEITWDTSKYLSYCLVPDQILQSQGPIGGYGISQIVGSPGGTGNVTVRLYSDDTLQYEATFASPYYVPTVNYATNVAVNTVNLGDSQAQIPLGSGVWIGRGKKGLVKVTRATSATTGGIGAARKED